MNLLKVNFSKNDLLKFRLPYIIGTIFIFITACHNNSNNNNTTTIAPPAIPSLSYQIISVYPHDTSSFTEGLEYQHGFLYESTGDPDYAGRSKLAKINVSTGKDMQKIILAPAYFGEGITLLNGKIYQLTYKEQKCFVYDAATLKKIKEFSYQGEGWGMTNDGKNLIMDNGTNNLIYRNPETFNIVKTIPIIGVPKDYSGHQVFINELEYVDGYIYANLYTMDFDQLVKIDTANGKVVGILNVNGLLERYAPPAETSKRDVLNGIAYDSGNKTFYITGKYWPKLFAIQIH
ncbi:MAG: glutaminyl-peptide cyclotransferase [Bacteroidota bacterium]|jgi:glutamine cyclotransferase|nr:glutaminyl-peptide cyclotransferase [Bacteroidota bacterium]